MDSSLWFDTYNNLGIMVRFIYWVVTGYNLNSKNYCISFFKDQFCLSKMKCCIMRHLIWVFIVCQSTHLGDTSIKRIKRDRTYSMHVITQVFQNMEFIL